MLRLLPLLLPLFLAPRASACTAVAAGRLATRDGATYVASSTDCMDCDFRLARVPARRHAPGTTRPVFLFRTPYPHVVADRAPTWAASNLEPVPAQRRAWLPATPPLATIPQVPRTHALFEGGAGYAMLNDQGVAVAESSCPARFVASPRGHGGHALLDVSELSRIALERAATARDAVTVMGQAAERYGFYGAGFDEPDAFMESGESLFVSDAREVWMFHVLPDDTGRSAVWAAQRVPDTDVAVVANVFMIRAVDTADNRTFMWSPNMHDVARRNGLWDPRTDGPVLDFTKAFTVKRVPSMSTYVTLRTWRIFTIVNPDLLPTLDPHTEERMEDYPFSVTPKGKVSKDDLFRIYKDHFEGTRFDLTRARAGGPFGDPHRYDPVPVGNMSARRVAEGEFGRAVSVVRTSYTAIMRSSDKLPREVANLVYFAQHAPATSVFVPLYLAVKDVPPALTRGSLFRHSNESLFWAVALASNWVHRYYKHAFPYLQQTQRALESYDIDATDAFLTALVTNGQSRAARAAMQRFSHGLVREVHAEYGALFWRLVARFHDGYIMADAAAPTINRTSMFYPEWWLCQVGYFTASETGGSYGRANAADVPPTGIAHEQVASIPQRLDHWTAATFFSGALVGALSCAALLHGTMRCGKQPRVAGYQPIR